MEFGALRLQNKEKTPILRPMLSTVIKIETLKLLGKLTADEKSLIRGIDLKKRVTFIYDNLLKINNSILDVRGIKGIWPVESKND